MSKALLSADEHQHHG
jgi:Na+-driven multidrug efflux pump